MPPRREPERTCVGCRTKGIKGEFVRVVRLPEGRVEPDPSGRAPGRGAYVHRSRQCIERAIRRGALAHALRSALEPAEAARLVQQLFELAGDDR